MTLVRTSPALLDIRREVERMTEREKLLLWEEHARWIADCDGSRLLRRSSGYVYFAQAGRGPIKIGSSLDPEERVKQLHWVQGDKVELLLQLPGGELRERSLHKLFVAHRISGEWFEPCSAIRAFIKQPFWALPERCG